MSQSYSHGRRGRGGRSRAARAAAPFLLTVVAVFGLLSSGCGGDQGAGAARSDSATEAASGASREAARDACELIPAEQVGGFVKDTVTTKSEPGRRQSVCTYLDKSGKFPYLRLTVYWVGGKEQLEAAQAGTRIAGDSLAAPGDEGSVDDVVKPGPVAGLGDAAFYHGIAPSLVLSGDVLLMFEMQMAEQRRAFRPLASTALSRL